MRLTNVLLQDKWSAVYSVQTILLSLQSLLGGKHCVLSCAVLFLHIYIYIRAEQRVPVEPGCLGNLGQP